MDLADDEQLIFSEHPSWRSIFGVYLMGILLVAVAAAVAGLVTSLVGDEVSVPIVVAVAVAGLLLVVGVGFVRRVGTTFTVSTRRVHVTRGILARQVIETRISRIQSTTTRQSTLQRLLGVGDVVLDSAGGEDDEIRFLGVRHPSRVARAVDRVLATGDAPARTGGGV